MVKAWTLVAMLLAGCALIDAAQGPDEIVIDLDDNNGEDGAVCAWVDCDCDVTGCDPKDSCTQTSCSVCESDADCFPGESCGDLGRCSSCANYAMNEPVSYESRDGTAYVCDGSLFSDRLVCVRHACFPEYQ